MALIVNLLYAGTSKLVRLQAYSAWPATYVYMK